MSIFSRILVAFMLMAAPTLATSTYSRYTVSFANGFGGRKGVASKGYRKKGKSSQNSNLHGLLSAEARKLLKRHKNDVDAASSAYFEKKLSKMAESNGAFGRASEDLHAARVAASWDTIAMFLPLDYARTKGKVEPKVDRRLRLIADSCCLNGRVLDVGCGDGAIVPYLIKLAEERGQPLDYLGLDVSSEMIDLARKRIPTQDGLTFSIGRFPEFVPLPDGASNGQGLYSTILFNGSLQFFPNTNFALGQAAKLLVPGGRIVLSHVEGGAFVKDECRRNPGVAVRNMPNRISLVMAADELGLTLLEKDDLLGEYNRQADGDNDAFYLCGLEVSLKHL